MKRIALVLFAAALALPAIADAARIKDIARWDGVEDNVVVGIGVVVGLQGTGDGGQAVRDFLRGAAGALESDIDPSKLRSKNSALVTVTATLPAFARKGNHIDVTVSSLGDAKSLSGGTLLPTMLRDTAGRAVWAVAEGSLTIGGYGASAGGAAASKNHTTVGRIPAGAKVVQELEVDMMRRDILHLSLRETDFHTAVGAARSVNRELLGDFAFAVNSGTIEVNVPPQYQGRVPELVARLEMLDVDTDVVAKVVVNERTGTVVMAADVRIATVAVAHGGLTLEVDTRLGVSQPGPFSGGETVVVPETSVEFEEENRRLEVVQGVSIGEVVGALNQLGVSPRDLISILQAIRSAGALNAELEVL